MKWIEKRYVLKLQRIAKVLKAVEDPIPGVVGLAEIENLKVLSDLVSACQLTEDEIGIIHADSPDERGMDVGLLYRKDLFRLHPELSAESIPVQFTQDPADKTRDVLKVPLLDQSGQLMVFYVTHWPSRKEGMKVTRDKRQEVAGIIRSSITDTISRYPEAGIVLMGDLNCTPDSPPVYQNLDQRSNPENPMINLGWDSHNQGKGSTNFRGKWLLFDQILVNQVILERFPDAELQIVDYPWMLYFNPRYRDFRPNKTYAGKHYHGGFSDHLPVALKLGNGNKKTGR